MISVIIPAYNEESYIGDCINSIRSSFENFSADYEIIVVDNNSTDQTVKIALDNNCKVIKESERNIGKVRNRGAKNATGHVLIFIDADSRLNEKLLKVAVSKIVDRSRVAVSSITEFDKYPTLTSYGIWLYNLLSVFLKLGIGQFIAIRKDSFTAVGGFPEEYFAFEEIYFFRKLKKEYSRKNFEVLNIPIVSSSRKFEKGATNTSKFLFQLLLVVIGFEIGKDKSELGFWYS